MVLMNTCSCWASALSSCSRPRRAAEHHRTHQRPIIHFDSFVLLELNIIFHILCVWTVSDIPMLNTYNTMRSINPLFLIVPLSMYSVFVFVLITKNITCIHKYVLKTKLNYWDKRYLDKWTPVCCWDLLEIGFEISSESSFFWLYCGLL